MLDKNASLTKECVELRNGNEELRRINGGLKSEIMEIRERCEVVTKELAESQNDFRGIIEKYKRDLEGLHKKMAQKDEEIANVKNAERAVRLEMAKLSMERQRSRAKCEDVQVEVMRFVNKNAELQKQNTVLAKKCGELQHANSEQVRLAALTPKKKIVTLQTSPRVADMDIVRKQTLGSKLPPPVRMNAAREDFGGRGSGFDIRRRDEEEKALQSNMEPSSQRSQPESQQTKRTAEIAGAKAFGETPGERISDFFASEEAKAEPEDPFETPYAEQQAPAENQAYSSEPDRKRVKSVALDSAEALGQDQQQVSQSFYGEGTENGDGASTQERELKLSNDIKYRDCLSASQAGWFEDRVLSIGLMRSVNQATKCVAYKVYFENKMKDAAVGIEKFDLVACDVKGTVIAR